MLSFKRYIQENVSDAFSRTNTGRAKIDDMLKNPKKYGVEAEVKMMTVKSLQTAMAKGQKTTVQKAYDKRMKMGGRKKVDNLKDLIKKGVKLDMPIIDYAPGGFVQDGFHRALAAQELGIKKIPVAVIKRKR